MIKMVEVDGKKYSIVERLWLTAIDGIQSTTGKLAAIVLSTQPAGIIAKAGADAFEKHPIIPAIKNSAIQYWNALTSLNSDYLWDNTVDGLALVGGVIIFKKYGIPAYQSLKGAWGGSEQKAIDAYLKRERKEKEKKRVRDSHAVVDAQASVEST